MLDSCNCSNCQLIILSLRIISGRGSQFIRVKWAEWQVEPDAEWMLEYGFLLLWVRHPLEQEKKIIFTLLNVTWLNVLKLNALKMLNNEWFKLVSLLQKTLIIKIIRESGLTPQKLTIERPNCFYVNIRIICSICIH